jgi:membrane protein DedA with SNARE-associated domain
VSPSKKANRKETGKKPKSAQKPDVKTSARSSRVVQGNAQAKKGNAKTHTRNSIKNTSTKRTSGKARSKPTQVVPAAKDTIQIQEQPQTKKSASTWQTSLLRAAALLAVIAITVYIYSLRDRVEEFERFGYVGIFLIALMANATVLLPAPGVAIIYAMGAVFNPLWVGLAAGTGGALGELSGYLAGFSGQAVVEKTNVYERFQPWVEKYGGWAILILSAIPNPFFDVAGIAAGIAKMPVQTFLLFTWVGQIIKMSTFAIAGYYSLEWLTNFMR